MKIAIIGSRNLVIENLERYISDECTEIVSGGAVGIDSCAADYAKAHGLRLTEFLPDYSKYGRAAPIVRNKSIVDYADEVLAFWDGKSRGTKSVISYCEKMKKPCSIILFRQNSEGKAVFERYLRENNYAKNIKDKEKIDPDEFDKIMKKSAEENYRERYRAALAKYLDEPWALVPGAHQNLLTVQKKCEEYARERQLFVRTKIEAESLSAEVVFKTPLLFFTEETAKLIEEIEKNITHITFLPVNGTLFIIFSVDYFENKKPPMQLAAEEVGLL